SSISRESRLMVDASTASILVTQRCLYRAYQPALARKTCVDTTKFACVVLKGTVGESPTGDLRNWQRETSLDAIKHHDRFHSLDPGMFRHKAAVELGILLHVGSRHHEREIGFAGDQKAAHHFVHLAHRLLESINDVRLVPFERDQEQHRDIPANRLG